MKHPPSSGLPEGAPSTDWQKIGVFVAVLAIIVGLIVFGIEQRLGSSSGTTYNGNNNTCISQGDENTVICEGP